jgi:hypothetical protein
MNVKIRKVDQEYLPQDFFAGIGPVSALQRIAKARCSLTLAQPGIRNILPKAGLYKLPKVLFDCTLLDSVIPEEAWNPGRTGSRLCLGQCMDPGFRRGDEWQHAIIFGKRHMLDFLPSNDWQLPKILYRLRRLSSAMVLVKFSFWAAS